MTETMKGSKSMRHQSFSLGYTISGMAVRKWLGCSAKQLVRRSAAIRKAELTRLNASLFTPVMPPSLSASTKQGKPSHRKS